MNKIIITGLILATMPMCGQAALNCCSNCLYNTTQTQCTTECCQSKYGASGTKTETVNHIIVTNKYNQTVICATSSTGTNLVSCTRTTTCACEKGYYGSPRSDFNGGCSGTCTACPDGGTTSGSGATSVSSCYLPSGTTGSDSTGSYKYTSDCYYS